MISIGCICFIGEGAVAGALRAGYEAASSKPYKHEAAESLSLPAFEAGEESEQRSGKQAPS